MSEHIHDFKLMNHRISELEKKLTIADLQISTLNNALEAPHFHKRLHIDFLKNIIVALEGLDDEMEIRNELKM